MSNDAVDDRATTKRDGIRLTWRETPRAAKAILLGIFVNRLAGFIAIFLVLFLTNRGFSASQAGFALGAYGAGAVVGTLLGGSLTDRLDPRTATLISMMGSAVLIVSILYLHVYALLLLAVFAVSTVGRLYQPAAQTLLTELTPPGRLVMVTAMSRLGINLGTTATPLIGAALLAISYNLLFWGEAAAALIYGVIALVALPRRVPKARPAADETATATRAATGGYLAMFANWRYTAFLAAVFLLSAAYVQYTATLPLAIVKAGLNLWWYGAIVSLNSVVVIVCELLMTKLVQNWPLRVTMFLGFMPVALGYAIYGLGIVPAVLIIGTLVWTLAEIIGAPTVFAYPGMTAPEHLRGRYIGAMQSVFGLGAAVGPIVGILVWNRVGQAVWLWVAFVAVLAAVAAQIAIRVPAARTTTEPVPEPAT